MTSCGVPEAVHLGPGLSTWGQGHRGPGLLDYIKGCRLRLRGVSTPERWWGISGPFLKTDEQ